MSWYKKAQTEIVVNLKQHPQNIPPKNRQNINRSIHDLGSYHQSIPLQDIFDILKANNTIPISEDGSYWSGFLIGGKECGEEGTKDQVALIDLAVDVNGQYFPCKQSLSLSWCKMPSGKYEIVAYVQ